MTEAAERLFIWRGTFLMDSVKSVLLFWLPEVKKNELISKNGEWILANVNCTGYYRVNYDPENWKRLLTQLETDPNVSNICRCVGIHPELPRFCHAPAVTVATTGGAMTAAIPQSFSSKTFKK